MPAPSPMTNPSRSFSNGRLARSGSSLRVDRARIAANPPTASGVIAASDPPAIITSASSRLMISKASPIACADAEQAVQVAEFGPLAWKRMETWPAARLMIDAGMKNGEIRRGPPSRRALCSRSMVLNPPMPEAMKTPTRAAFASVTVTAASSIAHCAAAIAYWMKTSIFLTSFLFTNLSGSNPLTSPAMRHENSAASKWEIGPMPLRPAHNASQFAAVPMPRGDTRPTPVTTTRLLTGPPCDSSLLLAVRFDVLDRFLDAGNLLRVLVRDLDAELLFEGHHQLHRVERVGAEVVDERGVRGDFFFVDAQLFDDDALDFVSNCHSILLHVHPAVDGEHVPCNIRRLVGCEKAHRRGDVVRGAEAAERNLRRPVDLRLFVDRPGHVGVDHARCDHVHGNRARRHFARQRLRKTNQSGFRRGVVG